ncbi:hypothetical protein, partial [Maribacter sp.]
MGDLLQSCSALFIRTKKSISFISDMFARSQQSRFGQSYLLLISILLPLFFHNNSFAQTIPDTEDTQLRSGVPPSGWTLLAGDPDTSNSSVWGLNGLSWVGGPYPPPTGHTYFLTAGSSVPSGEAVFSTVTGLTVGEEYTFTFYVAGFRTTTTSLGNNYQIYVGNETSGLVTFSSTDWVEQTFTFTADYASENIFIFGQSSGNANTHISFMSNAVAIDCVVNVAPAPSLSNTTITNTCPTKTVDLTTITANNTPSGATMTWHTSTPATSANQIANQMAIAAEGTYYGAFYYTATGCYGATTSIPVSLDTDCDSIVNADDLDDDNDGILDTVECPQGAISSVLISSNADLNSTKTIPGNTITFTTHSDLITQTPPGAFFSGGGAANSFALGTTSGNTAALPFEIDILDPVAELSFTIYDIDGSVTNIPANTESVSLAVFDENDLALPINPSWFTLGSEINFTSSATVATFESDFLDGNLLADPRIRVDVSIPEVVGRIVLSFTKGDGMGRIAYSPFSFVSLTDTDGDALLDHLDLDSDNDGIYDVVEGGALGVSGVIDSDNNGVIDGTSAAFGSNGLF